MRAPSPLNRLLLTSAAIALAAGVLYAHGLAFPGHPYWDETWYVSDARRVIDPSVVLDNEEHPPLGKIVIGVCMALLGDGPAGWRAASIASTVALLFMLPFLLRAIRAPKPGEPAAPTPLLYLLLPAALVALDPIIFVNARIATLDAQLGLLYVGAAYALALALREEPADLRWAVAASLLTGAALATKWTAITIAPAFLALVFLRVRNYQAMSIPPRTGAAFLAPAAVIYAAAFLAAGYTVVRMLELQWKMAGYHTWYFPPYWRSSLADWLIGRMPVWMDFEREGSLLRVIISVGSPVACLTGFAALVAAGITGFRRRHQLLMATAFFPLAQVALWAAAIRAIYVYYLSAMLPFAALAVAWWLAELHQRGRRVLAGALAGGLVVFAAGYLAFLYPLMTGAPLDAAEVAHYFEGPRSALLMHPGVSLDLVRSRLDERDQARDAQRAREADDARRADEAERRDGARDAQQSRPAEEER